MERRPSDDGWAQLEGISSVYPNRILVIIIGSLLVCSACRQQTAPERPSSDTPAAAAASTPNTESPTVGVTDNQSPPLSDDHDQPPVESPPDANSAASSMTTNQTDQPKTAEAADSSKHIRIQVEPLLQMWSAGSASEQNAAAQQLAQFGDDLFPALAGILQSTDQQLRRAAAAFMIDRVSARHTTALTALGRCLCDADPELRHQALQALESLPEPVLVPLRAQLAELVGNSNEDETYRVRAARLLGRCGTAVADTTDSLVTIARSETALRVRRAVLTALARIAPPKQIEPVFIDLLKGPTPQEIRQNLPMLLSRVATSDHSIDVLIALFDDQDAELRKESSRALVAIGKPTVPSLIAALQTPSQQRRRYAIYTLGKLGPLAADAVPTLKRLKRDPNPAIAPLAKAALTLIER